MTSVALAGDLVAQVGGRRLRERRLARSARTVSAAPLEPGARGGRGRRCPRGLLMSSSADRAARRATAGRSASSRCGRRALAGGIEHDRSWRDLPASPSAGCRSLGLLTQPPMMAREQAGTSAGVHDRSPSGGTWAASPRRTRSGQALGDAAGAPHQLGAGEAQQRRAARRAPCLGPARLAEHPGVLGPTPRGWRRSRSAQLRVVTVPQARRPANGPSRSGVAGQLVDDAARTLAGEERDRVGARRDARARPTAAPTARPSSFSAKQNVNLPGLP